MDLQKKFASQARQLEKCLLANKIFNRQKKTIFLATYIDMEYAATTLANQGMPTEAVVSFIPDPWRAGELIIHTSPKSPKNAKHLVVVHDLLTAQELRRIRPNSTAEVLPLGTSSDPYFLLEEPSKPQEELHIGIESSGNPLPNYDELVVQFIHSIKDELKKGEFLLTIHTMHHKSTFEKIKDTLTQLNLVNAPNIRLIRVSSILEAVESRARYIRGEYDDNWPAPQVVISKGGEVPLEYRGNQLVVCIFGGGHEDRDIEVGVKEGRAADFRRKPPNEWLSLIKKIVEERKKSNTYPPQSLACFAPLLIFNLQALQNYLSVSG